MTRFICWFLVALILSGAGLQVGHGSGMALIVDGCAGQQMEANILSAEVVVYRDETFANVHGCDLASAGHVEMDEIVGCGTQIPILVLDAHGHEREVIAVRLYQVTIGSENNFHRNASSVVETGVIRLRSGNPSGLLAGAHCVAAALPESIEEQLLQMACRMVRAPLVLAAAEERPAGAKAARAKAAGQKAGGAKAEAAERGRTGTPDQGPTGARRNAAGRGRSDLART